MMITIKPAVRAACPKCGGHGQITHGGVSKDCNYCGGTGQVSG